MSEQKPKTVWRFIFERQKTTRRPWRSGMLLGILMREQERIAAAWPLPVSRRIQEVNAKLLEAWNEKQEAGGDQ